MCHRQTDFTAKCTTCRKTWKLTPEQIREAKAIGVPFSPCCQAVSTVESVTRRPKRKAK